MGKLTTKRGMAPGSVVFTGNRKVEKVHVHYLQYDEDTAEESVIDSHDETTIHASPDDKVDWYDFRGMHDIDLIEFFGKHLDIHPLVLEGVTDINQRPKYEEYARGNFITVKALAFDKKNLKVQKEHVAVYFRQGIVMSFQETESDLFHSVRERINAGRTRIRQRGADYLAYAIIDAVVDNYYMVLEDMEEVIEQLEDRMLEHQDVKSKGSIHHLKKELLVLRKSIAPLREAIGKFSKTESAFVEDHTRIYIRDLYDHTIQIMDSVESYRDMLNGLQDLFISEVSFKMNKVMQLLTLVSTIFIPLTFLAGIYGMNFQNMPELHYKYGYYVLLGVMLVICILLLVFFKRKKWM